jgi:beta-lactamase regulating signal transducer with metallopeptidase domain
VDDLLSITLSNAVAATLLALVALAVGAVYRRPALMHGLWLLVLLKLVTPPLLFLPVSWPTVEESPSQEITAVREEPTIATDSAVGELQAIVIVPVTGEAELSDVETPVGVDALEAVTQPRAPMAPQPSLWPQILTIVWGVGALTWFLLALERLHRFRRLLRFARPASAALQGRTRRLANALGLKRCPRVRLLPGRIAPMLWAIGGPPRLLVPADLLDLLNDEQLDTLLLHELAHLRRCDHWVRIVEFVVMGLYWWHPVVWYARRELHEAEEQCCDAWVVSTLPDAGRTYASALLDTLDFLSTAQAAVPPLASGLGQLADLKRRLTMIMRGNTPRSLTWPGCLAVVAFGLTVLPMLPSLHGQAPSKQDASKTEVEAARAQLEEAKARLDKQKSILESQRAAVAEAEAQLKKAAQAQRAAVAQAEAQLKAATQKVEEATLRRAKSQRQKEIELTIEAEKLALDQKLALIGEAQLKKKAAYRIEITLPADGKLNPKEVVEKIKKVLLEKVRASVVLRPVEESPAVHWHLEVPKMHMVPAVEFRAPRDLDSGAGSSPDKRINELEKKLEKVLQELHELRKQMKESRSGASTTPSSTPYHLNLVVPDIVVPLQDKPRPAPKPPVERPYSAPAVPLKPAPVDPARR